MIAEIREVAAGSKNISACGFLRGANVRNIIGDKSLYQILSSGRFRKAGRDEGVFRSDGKSAGIL